MSIIMETNFITSIDLSLCMIVAVTSFKACGQWNLITDGTISLL